MPLPQNQLDLIPAVEELGRKFLSDIDEELGEGETLVDRYCEYLMENLSEGSGQISPAEERSCRAFVNVLRVNPDHLNQLKDAIGYRPTAYHDYAIADLIMSALSLNESCASALETIYISFKGDPKGPFYPKRETVELLPALTLLGLKLPTASADELTDDGPTCGAPGGRRRKGADPVYNYIEHKALQFKGPRPVSDADRSLISLASLFKLDKGEVDQVVAGLKRAGLEDEKVIQLAFAAIVVSAVGATTRYAQGIKWSQPDSRRMG